MINRRAFLGFMRKAMTFLGLIIITPFRSVTMSDDARPLKRLPKGTDLNTLLRTEPSTLDTSELEITPLEDFQTMGLEDWEVDLNRWGLKVDGNLDEPLLLSYSQILDRPSLERDALLICPGFFAQHGRWKGISIAGLFKEAGLKSGVKWVTISGPQGPYKKTARFPIEDAMEDKLFLAYQVNGKKLPQKHGFPLRLVHGDQFADDWIKYVDLVTADI
jgi:sulfoxide reductase catalytic subunit YedY